MALKLSQKWSSRRLVPTRRNLEMCVQKMQKNTSEYRFLPVEVQPSEAQETKKMYEKVSQSGPKWHLS